jgi:hypothetical protein
MDNYTGNNVYFSVTREGEQPIILNAKFKSITINTTAEVVDTTRGSGAEYMSRNVGLLDCTIDGEFGYMTKDAANTLRALGPQDRVFIDVGPEGAIAGKPRHAGWFIITSCSFDQTVSKDEITFAISASQAEAPETDIRRGGVYGA